ncbi:hypothetical protein [Kitasatospora sp. GP82]|uniref:hypothetical protein n=1 Tax=Kitasatospora sp. GP82 TaxID=3035089 RepID=UPI0024755521|nr:hypothetical protein [Kitasatospora sp. GP82]MDH6126057.1 hypothetical protein [Kitasatospora sp. GP82]
MGLRDLVIDAWSWLNYKPVMATPPRRGFGPFGELAASWVPPEDLRRLQAYKLLAAYDHNQAGQLAAAAGDETGLERRELGDAAKLIDTALGYLLGSEQTIVVPGAEQQNDPVSGGAGGHRAVQEQLRAWAEKELLPLRIQQAERAAIRSGDAVYTLAWEPSKGRPALRTIDAGFYFPEWSDDETDAAEYPTRVHFAWELPEDDRRGLKARLRRITYELGPIGAATQPGVSKDGFPVREWVTGPDGDPVLIVGDQLVAESGMISRTYPWAPGRPSGVTCYLTDAEWLLDDLKAQHDVYNLPMEKAAYRVRSDGEVLQALDLMIDFLPVVHLTNTIPDAGEHWGQPLIAKVMQTLDELAATDSDSAAASATTGTPIIGLSGVRLPKDRTTGATLPLQVRADTVWSLADGGSMHTLDTSAQLAELRSRIDHLLDRVAGNSRLTSSGLGTIDPASVPSGYALQLALGPLDSLVAAMRLARTHKYALLLKMACRLYQAGRAEGWPAGESLPAKLVWGPHTPTDRAAVLDEVVTAYTAGVLSLETAVRMLSDAGYPIEDPAQEIQQIQARAAAAAAHQATMTADMMVQKLQGLPPDQMAPTPRAVAASKDLPGHQGQRVLFAAVGKSAVETASFTGKSAAVAEHHVPSQLIWSERQTGDERRADRLRRRAGRTLGRSGPRKAFTARCRAGVRPGWSAHLGP